MRASGDLRYESRPRGLNSRAPALLQNALVEPCYAAQKAWLNVSGYTLTLTTAGLGTA
jgi:hypothetical protein